VRNGLIALEETATLLRRHAVELGETVAHALLGLSRKVVEAGLALERLLLLIERKAAMSIHPLCEMLLILSGV